MHYFLRCCFASPWQIAESLIGSPRSLNNLELVRDTILIRTRQSGVHPRVDYSISDYGSTMAPVLEAICACGRKHLALKQAECESAAR